MKKTNIANELLKNTTNEYLKVFITNYILNMEELENGYDGDEDLIRFHNCITYIEKEKFDITGWELFEIPIFYAHCFRNEKTNQNFDLAVWEIGEVIPRYLDDNFNEQDSKSIQEAIDNYSF
ncbi:putatice ATPase [Bacillus sp. TS-2]|nr:putatice ATPase [Bacillus sp. TS-2]